VPRHQTLQAMIDWSCQMLTPEERLFFTRLSIFAGGWTLEAAESICTDERINQAFALDLLTRLVNKSLVILDRRPGRQGRYRFLEPIRQYARGMLEDSRQLDQFAARHLNYYLAFAEKNSGQLSGEDQVNALERMEREGDNLRAALAWSLTKPEKTHENLHLSIALGNFWLVRGNLQEGREWLAKILADEDTRSHPTNRAQVLNLAAMMAYRQSDYPAAKTAWEESLHTSRTLGDEGLNGIHLALTGLAMVASEGGDFQTAPQLLKEALEITRQIGDELNEADILRNLGWAAMRPGDYQQAKTYLQQAAALFRKLNEKVGLSSSYSGLGEVALRQGELAHARIHLEEALNLRRELDYKWGIGATLGTLGWVAISAGDYQRARQVLGESLTVRQELGDKGGIAWCLEKLAHIAHVQADHPHAVRLHGAAAAIRQSINSVIDPADQPEYEQEIATLKANLPEEDFQALWHEGAAMSVDQIVKATLAGMSS
jgi:tetratricopeptide (TPR) repeat protein